MVIYCNKCGQENPDDAKYCSKCGNVIKDYEKDKVQPVKKKVDDVKKDNKPKSEINKSKKILLGIGVFIIAFILFVAIGIIMQPTTSLMGEYQINFNNNYNDRVIINFGGNSYNKDLSKGKTMTSNYGVHSYEEGDITNLKLEVCSIPPEFSSIEKKCDIIKYKITSQNEQFYTEETYCSECKRELNVVKSIKWIKKDE